MDKKNTVIGVALLVAAFAIYIWGNNHPPKPAAAPEAPSVATAPAQPIAATPSSAPAPAAIPAGSPLLLPATGSTDDGDLVPLENGQVRVRISRRSASIVDVALLGRKGDHLLYPSTQGSDSPYLINGLHAYPALVLLDLPGAGMGAEYSVVSAAADRVVLRTATATGLEVERSYAFLSGKDPHLVRVETRLTNTTASPVDLPAFGVNLGTGGPVNSHDSGTHLTAGYHNGEESIFIDRSAFTTGGVLGFGQKTEHAFVEQTAPIMWASVKNQFFSTIALFDEAPARPGSLVAQRVLLPKGVGEESDPVGITATARYAGFRLEPGASRTLGIEFYAGPKEYGRLAELGQARDEVMQLGFFGFVAKILLLSLQGLHSFLGNWGVAIIALTAVIKLIFWPLTAISSRSAKRMAKVAPLMKELQEKYKDRPEKLNREMMELYRKYKVNPFGGCLPILIQIPIFFGLFSMLQSASELRYASFLWVQDLSASDTVGHIYGFPINILPLFMAATQFLMMRLTPTPPSADKFQTQMFKVMPFIFTFFCYFFASGLVLYWTVQNLFSILQQYLINRQPDEPLEPAPAAPAKGGKTPRPASRK